MGFRVVALVAVAVLFVGGCGDGDDDGQALPPPSATGTSTGTGPDPTPSDLTVTPSPSPTGPTIPTDCQDVVPFTRVAQALAVPVEGDSIRVYDDTFQEPSGRTGRLTCGYGAAPPAGGGEPVPKVEIAVSSYTDPATAAGRIDLTVGDVRGRGGQVEAFEIAGRPGFFLTDAEAVTYVVADDDKTLVVTLVRGVVPQPAERVVLVTLVETALADGPSATPTT
ncbi:MAG: hypothetical protein ACRDWI_00260 [Jiangellaceae bacterium]